MKMKGQSENLPIKKQKFRKTAYKIFKSKKGKAIKNALPQKSDKEITRILSDEWRSLSPNSRKPYLFASNMARKRFDQQLEPAKQKYDNYGKKMNSCENQTVHTEFINNQISLPGKMDGKNVRIPIFTEEFIYHNKDVDSKVRDLRKLNLDYEKQNYVLEMNIESMRHTVGKIESENIELYKKNKLLEKYLRELELRLAIAFRNVAIPNQPNGASIDGIDEYMVDLYNICKSSPTHSNSLQMARDIMKNIDLNIQL